MHENKPRTHISATGSFVSVPSAFKNVPEGLEHVLKMEFRTVFSEENILGDTTYSPDWVLVDVGAAVPDSLDFKRIARDCDLLKDIALNYPDQLRQLIKAFQPNASLRERESAFKIAQEIGLTEEASIQAGGGLLGLLVLVGGALLLAGCEGCTAHGHSNKEETNHPN
jgi:hypothetical protein